MGKYDLSNKPHNLKGKSCQNNSEIDAWYYEENGGLLLYIDCGPYSKYKLKIPWRSIRAALRRKDK